MVKRVLCGMLLMGMVAARAGAAEKPTVKVEAFANTTAVRAGQTFQVAVRIKLEPGWYVYWDNAGDAGLATKVKLQVPAGYTAKLLAYPIPEKFVVSDIVAYGY